jgi:LysM repeat protein
MTHENKVKYIIAKKGDTFYRIAKEYELGLWQLYKYNDFGPKKDVLIEGDIVYIQPKRSKSKNKEIKLDKAMTLREVSQKEAIKLDALIRLNNISSGDEILPKGEKVTLH